MKELNESEALKEARQKFVSTKSLNVTIVLKILNRHFFQDKVEKETAESSEVIRHRVKEFKDHIDKMVVEIQKTKAGKQLSVASQEMIKQAKVAAELAEKAAREIGNTQAYKQVSSVAKEIDNIAGVTMYSRPRTLYIDNNNDFN